jgi:hypothetical protein
MTEFNMKEFEALRSEVGSLIGQVTPPSLTADIVFSATMFARGHHDGEKIFDKVISSNWPEPVNQELFDKARLMFEQSDDYLQAGNKNKE